MKKAIDLKHSSSIQPAVVPEISHVITSNNDVDRL